MRSLYTSESEQLTQYAEAQMRKADSFKAALVTTRRRAVQLRLRERSFRELRRRELARFEGPRAVVLRALERRADAAHDQRLFELANEKTLIRSIRDVELQAHIFYEQADGR